MSVVPKVFFNGFTGRGNACKLERTKNPARVSSAEGWRKPQRKLGSKCIRQVHAPIAHSPGNGHRAEGIGYLRTWHQALGAHRGACRW